MRDTRKATTRLLGMLDEGVIDARTLVLACLNYMSEAEVADMAESNEFFTDDTDDDESEDDE